MNSISSSMMPPRDMLTTQLQSQISTGDVKESDEGAISAALDSIDASVSSSAPNSGSTPPSPDEMQDKVDELIAEQVSSGALSKDQAEELSQIFADTFSGSPGGGKGPGGPGGGKGPGGPGGPGGPESLLETDDSEETDAATMLADFLKQIQEQQGTTSYSQTGGTELSSATSLLLSISA